MPMDNTLKRPTTLRKLADYISLERNVALASAAVFILGLGEELFLPLAFRKSSNRSLRDYFNPALCKRRTFRLE